MFQTAPGFIEDKIKLLFVSKKFLKRTRTKAFVPKFSSNDKKRFVSIQNFVSKTNIFDLFWNKSSKTKAFDLERTLV
jgi:predicted patatin/cPLA2 family phospholipase